MRSRRRDDGPSDPLAAFLVDPSVEGRIVGAKRAKSDTDLEASVSNAAARVRSGEWSDADGRLLVGLYAWCHRATYGILPPELEDRAEFRAASRAALKTLHDSFEDDGPAVVVFMRWAWKREKERSAWATREKIDRNRMGWRLQFSLRLVGDYRVATARRG